MARRVFYGTVVAVLVAAAQAGFAADVAEVTKVDRIATASDAGCAGADPSDPNAVVSADERIQVGQTLATDRTGRLGIFFVAARRSIDLGSLAKVELVKSGKFYKICKGTTLASGHFGDIPFLTGNASVSETQSTFIITYDPESNVTEVTVVSGSVTVRNLKGGRARTILAREHTRVVGGMEPTSPEFLDSQDFEGDVAPFEFIGRGRPESLSIAVSQGTALPPPQIVVDSWPWPGERVPFTFTKEAAEAAWLGIDF